MTSPYVIGEDEDGWILVCTDVNGELVPVPDAPLFTSAASAQHWIDSHADTA